MINVADADARTVSINETFAEATGYGRDEVIGRSL
ncbi:PAS domain-containing protein, partial [Solirhodobacter olei]